MSSSCVVEQLSGYLDGEVSPRAQTVIEKHLNDCRECRHHLEGLRAVVSRLESLERVMPPLTVSRAVHQRARALTGTQKYSIRWERLANLMVFESSVLPFLALVVALGGIALVFTSALERSNASKSQLIWIGHQPERVSPSVKTEEQQVVAGRVFDRVEGGWVEQGLHPAETPDRRGEATSDELAVFSKLKGRVLLRLGSQVVEVVFEETGAPSTYSE